MSLKIRRHSILSSYTKRTLTHTQYILFWHIHTHTLYLDRLAYIIVFLVTHFCKDIRANSFQQQQCAKEKELTTYHMWVVICPLNSYILVYKYVQHDIVIHMYVKYVTSHALHWRWHCCDVTLCNGL